MKSMTKLISRESQEKYTMFLSGRAEYGVFEGRDLAAATKGNSAFIASFADLEGVDIRRFEADGVRLEDISIPGAEKGKYIYYIHGGGFVVGEPAWGYFYAVEAAKLSHRNILAVDYRLGPDYPFPAGPEDCIKGYEWMLNSGIQPEDIVMLGESSGGNLILAVCAACKVRGIPMPKALCPVSPVVDLDFPFPSYTERNERECILPKNQRDDVKMNYLKDMTADDILASPYRADVTGFPSTYHIVASEEMLFDDSIYMHEKLLRSGVDAKLKVWEGMWHTFCMIDLPESRQVIRDIADFFNEVG
ncbi:MAG TPA: hypothetical protein DEV97_12470 [Lachnospiraceae bacterium]|nr:hypothetical protein [Lachnospiraceae bacterium]